MLMLVIEMNSGHKHIDEGMDMVTGTGADTGMDTGMDTGIDTGMNTGMDTGKGEMEDSWTGLLHSPDLQVIFKISAVVA